MKRSLTVFAAAALLIGMMATTALAAGTVTVSPATPGNWRAYVGGAGSVDLVNGPTGQPLGSGSVHFVVPAGADFAMARTTDYDGVKLASLTKLTYWTYVHTNVNCQATYISLNLNQAGTGSTVDDQLNFEPCYQSGEYQDPLNPPFPLLVPDQCPNSPNDQFCFPKDTWVQWDAMVGAWWASSQQGPDIVLTTLARYLALHPNATIVGRTVNSYRATVQQPIDSGNTSNWSSKSKGTIPVMFKLELSSGIFGGFRLANGDGWTGFNGNADALTVGVLADDTTYNFEGVGTLPSAQGAFAPTCTLPTPASIRVTFKDPVPDGTVNETVTTYPSDNNSLFRVVDCKYQYNLSIPSLTSGPGTYKVEILIDSVVVGTAQFDLK
jgi:hypothetical protein